MPLESTTPSPSNVMTAARSCNSILKSHGISHAFLGGFVMNHLDKNRHAESLDLEIRKPIFVTWAKIMGLFKETGHYHVMAGSNADMMTEKDGFTKRLRMRLVDIIAGVQISIFERSEISAFYKACPLVLHYVQESLEFRNSTKYRWLACPLHHGVVY